MSRVQYLCPACKYRHLLRGGVVPSLPLLRLSHPISAPTGPNLFFAHLTATVTYMLGTYGSDKQIFFFVFSVSHLFIIQLILILIYSN